MGYAAGNKKTVTDPFLGKVELTCTGASRFSAMGESRVDSVWVDLHLNVWIFTDSTVGSDHPPVVLRKDLAEQVSSAVRPVRSDSGHTMVVRKSSPEHPEYLKSRFPKEGRPSTFLFKGHRWRYEHSSFDDEGEFDVLWRPDAAIEPVPAAPIEQDPAPKRKFPPVMDIWSPRGTKVTPIYVDGKVFGGYPFHARTAERYLKEGSIYTVDRTDVDRSHTDVFLQEVPGVAFNSVCLAHVAVPED